MSVLYLNTPQAYQLAAKLEKPGVDLTGFTFRFHILESSLNGYVRLTIMAQEGRRLFTSCTAAPFYKGSVPVRLLEIFNPVLHDNSREGGNYHRGAFRSDEFPLEDLLPYLPLLKTIRLSRLRALLADSDEEPTFNHPQS